MNKAAAPMRPWSTVSLPIASLLLAVAYFVGARAGFALTSPHEPAALLWPPNALLLAALLLAPLRTWPVLIAAVLPAHMLAEMSAGVPLSMTILWFVSNVVEALIGAFAIRGYLHRVPRFDGLRDVAVFLICAPLLGTLLSSFLDAGFVAAIGWRYSDFWTVWRTRMLSNTLATLTMVPLIVSVAQTGLRFTRQHGVRDIVEAAALLIGLWTTCALVFIKTRSAADDFMHLYMPLIFLLWAAMRLSISGVSLCVASVAGFALSGILHGRGPFLASDPVIDAMGLQVFLIIASVSLLLQCVSLSELRNARHIAIRRGEQLEVTLRAARMGTWDWEIGSDRILWSNAAIHFGEGEVQFEMTLRRMFELIHPDDRAAVSAAFSAVVTGADHMEVEFRWSNEDPANDSAWAAAIGKVSVRDDQRRLLGVHMNISERKQQELQMQEQREQLSHLSRVAMLGELSGALAHELSQPLTAMLANAQAALRRLMQGSPAELPEIIEDIVLENKRAGEVIRRLRALFAQGTSDAAPVDINDCVRDVLSLSHSDLVARNVTSEVRLARNLPDVWADRIQLQQVLLNLILNACDAMREVSPGERHLRICTQLTEQGEVSIEVGDQGTGIGDVEKIFEPFFTTKQHGLGLGLAICRTIVGAHRGRLWAANNPHGGAIMHIVLPVQSASEQRRAAAERGEHAT